MDTGRRLAQLNCRGRADRLGRVAIAKYAVISVLHGQATAHWLTIYVNLAAT